MLKNMYRLFIAIGLFTLIQCSGYDSRPEYPGNKIVNDSLLTNTYPKFYEAVYSRNEAQLRPYFDHDLIEIRKQAWRALTNTPIDSLDRYIQLAKKSKLEVAWFALSLHQFTAEQIRGIEQYWIEQPDKRGGVSLILGRQGDKQSLDFLINRIEQASGSSYEYQFALAIGRIMTRFELAEPDQVRLLEAAFSSAQSMVTRAYLYGYYRGDLQILTPDLEKKVQHLWQDYGIGTSSFVDQYVIHILNDRVFNDVVLYYHDQGLLEHNIQLGIELAQTLADAELNTEIISSTEILLKQSNPHVVQQTLQALEGKLTAETNLIDFVTENILKSEETVPFVWLQALKTLAETDDELIHSHRERLKQVEENRPYLLPYVLGIYEQSETAGPFIERIAGIVNNGEIIRSMTALQSLNAYWQTLEDSERTNLRRRKMRNIVFRGLDLKDRGIAFVLQGLLSDARLFSEDDFNRINRALSAFELPADIEVYQAFGSLYQDRFEKQARPVIDSLASLGYAPLNRSLVQQGWAVNIPEEASIKFRTPDWERLWRLGTQPIWVLETEKGDIEIQMNTLSAPATVSAIDSLTRAGAYDGIPFHRVVPNFVIQGGDVERTDGFGGPDFVIPTEAGETGYFRGAVGIASAGTDTEGSQYFIMHQWKPHLNGRYTLFGIVTEGMEVVDRIVVGDKVQRAYWEEEYRISNKE